MDNKEWTWTTFVSIVELYLDQTRDLLADDKNVHPLKSSDSQRIPVNSKDEIITLINEATKKRVTKETSQNDRSSRSHAIFQIHLRGQSSKNRIDHMSTLTVIDLAGNFKLKFCLKFFRFRKDE